jgi:hypothetical protein
MSKAANETKEIRKRWNGMRKRLNAMASEYMASEHEEPAYKIFGYTFMFSSARKSATVRVWPEYVGTFLGYEPVADFIRDTDCKVEVEKKSIYENEAFDILRFVF